MRAGKGTLATYMIRRAVDRGNRVLFLVNRRGLVFDLSGRLDRMGLDHGIIMAGTNRRKPWLNVHVASIDTLCRRGSVPKADMVVIDECHLSISPSWHSVISKYAGIPVIGMSASPIRSDGRGLGELYKSLVLGPMPGELVERGFLVPTRVFAPSQPDLAGLRVQAGDYNKRQLAEVVDQ